MDLTPWLPLLRLIHVLAAFGFVLVHGASAMVAFKLRGERDRTRIQALLELSNAFLNWMYVALLVLLVAGILSGIAGGHWTDGRYWLWASLGLLIAIIAAMYVFAAPHFEALRHALGMATFNDLQKKLTPPPPATDAELARLLESSKPMQAAVIGIGGIALVVALMMLKPF
ncbi:MAG: hypothetical protein HYX54_00745 [Chloroflexi bacterium]|nr:hypothetical protein [Chloroflexota bacterium]